MSLTSVVVLLYLICWCEAGNSEQPSFGPSSSSSLQPSSLSSVTRLRAQSKTCCCLEAGWNMETVLPHHGSIVFLMVAELFCLNSALERKGKREYLVKRCLYPGVKNRGNESKTECISARQFGEHCLISS